MAADPLPTTMASSRTSASAPSNWARKFSSGDIDARPDLAQEKPAAPAERAEARAQDHEEIARVDIRNRGRDASALAHELAGEGRRSTCVGPEGARSHATDYIASQAEVG